MFKLTIALALIALVAGEKKDFENYKGFRANRTNDKKTSFLYKLFRNSNKYNFWNGLTYINVSADLMIAQEKIEDIKKLISLTETRFEIHVENVQSLIDNENRTIVRAGVAGFNWTNYHDLDEIYAYLEKLANDYPDNVELLIGGQTHENRSIKGVKLSFKKNNPGVFIEGGIHPREWISPATVTYILNEFLTSKDLEIRQLAESNDWYIFPVFNPDGFVYTHNKDRMWRKSRRPYGLCHGADLNRNWGYKWMEGGASRDPCADGYAGTAPFSDIETATLSKYITSISHKIYAYISFHNYGQLLSFPYGHTTAHLDNYDELYAIGKKTIEGLAKRYGTQYMTGNIAENIYIATGSSIDWVKGTLKIPLVYTYELRDNGKYGFELPVNQIIPTGQETLDSLIALFKEAGARGIPKRQ